MSGYNPFRHRKMTESQTSSLPVTSDDLRPDRGHRHQHQQHHHLTRDEAGPSPELPPEPEQADPFQTEVSRSDDDDDDDNTLSDTIEDTPSRSSVDSSAAGRRGFGTDTAVQALPIHHPTLVTITAGSRRSDASASMLNGVSHNLGDAVPRSPSASRSARPDRKSLSAMEDDFDLAAPVIRSGNSQKKPPPPPRGHHGKPIGRQTATSKSPSLAMSTRSTMSSENEPSRRSSIDRTPSAAYSSHDYFSTPLQTDNQSPASAHTLGRSQSQGKRPPTPPLSRRQSHMRRTQSSSTTNPARLSLQVDHVQLYESPRGSPTRSSFAHTPLADRSTHHLGQLEGVKPSAAASVQNNSIDTADPSTEAIRGGQSIHSTSNRALKRLSQPTAPPTPASMPPPPPPPRRLRGSSRGSADGPRRKSIIHDEKVETRTSDNEIFPHPSNASDILADLSKLQKEVDDLRGHFERRKVSH